MQDASENRKMIAKMRIDGNITWGKKKKKNMLGTKRRVTDIMTSKITL